MYQRQECICKFFVCNVFLLYSCYLPCNGDAGWQCPWSDNGKIFMKGNKKISANNNMKISINIFLYFTEISRTFYQFFIQLKKNVLFFHGFITLIFWLQMLILCRLSNLNKTKWHCFFVLRFKYFLPISLQKVFIFVTLSWNYFITNKMKEK